MKFEIAKPLPHWAGDLKLNTITFNVNTWKAFHDQVHPHAFQAFQAQIILNFIIIQISYMVMKLRHQGMDISISLPQGSHPFKYVLSIISNFERIWTIVLLFYPVH